MSKFKDQPPEYFSTRTASQYLGVSAGWLSGARCHGKGPPYVRMGRTIRYRRLTLEKWMTQREHDPRASSQVAQREGASHGA
ncbi:MAG: helix-turn-helix transcriptional regulator [Rhizomicrobium sp.]